MTIFFSNRDIYEVVICGIVPPARERLKIVRISISSPRFVL